ncbi:MAG TPA: hypothetical protein VKA00_03855 [Trueperaceae bacterium]|nr:hypothetical protein [Trueperaceae bacterium]
MEPKFKLVSSNNFELFEERLNDFVASLARDDVIVDVKFSTASLDMTVEYCALVHYQQTESWDG